MIETKVPTVVAIGNFDGVHRGHQELIRVAVRKAESLGAQVVALTFLPHPQQILRPDLPFFPLNTQAERSTRLYQAGAQAVEVHDFSSEFSRLVPEEFFQKLILEKFSAKAVVVGYNFFFGRDRQGDTSLLKTLCREAQIECLVVDPVTWKGGQVSSRLIREALSDGRIEEANALLGYSFQYRGVVVEGSKRGRTIGFRTANLRPEPKLLLPRGVYATEVLWESSTGKTRQFLSVTNIGVRPTFQDSSPSIWIETHLLDFDEDLYGEVLTVGFRGRIRDETKFASLEELKERIRLDIEAARKFFSTSRD